MFEETIIERMVLYQPNFRFFSVLFTTSNQFQTQAGLGLVLLGSGFIKLAHL